jgi:hypothetical protein
MSHLTTSHLEASTNRVERETMGVVHDMQLETGGA